MSALIEVIDSGLSVTIQDRGRPGYRSIGVPLSGALDPLLLAAANALLGNDAQAAALEVVMSGPSLKAVADSVRISLAGELSAKVLRSNGNILLVYPWSTATLFPGDIAQVGAMRGGVGYVGISGGFGVDRTRQSFDLPTRRAGRCGRPCTGAWRSLAVRPCAGRPVA